MTTIAAKSGHTLKVVRIDAQEFLEAVPGAEDDCTYSHYYKVCNWDANGAVFFYMAKGYVSNDGTQAKGQIHVWYRKSKLMWTSFGKSFQSAIDGAMKDAWAYA